MKLISQTMRTRQDVSISMRRALPAAVLFCIATFAISSIRASLNPENTFNLLDPKRIALVVAGAGVFWFAIRKAQQDRPHMCGLGRIALAALPGLALLFAIAVGWDVLIRERFESVFARNLRWILLWSGYFGTGIAAWLSVQYAAALAHTQTEAQRQPHPEGPSQSGARQSNHSPEPGTADGGFWVKTGRQTIRIGHDAIEWIEAEGNYARIHGSGSENGLVRMTLAAIEAELDHADFIRIHRSALCRRSAIRGYRRRPSGAMLVLLASGAEAPLGRSYAKILVEQARRLGLSGENVTDDTVSLKQRETQQG